MKIKKAIKIFLEENPKETKFKVIKHKKLVIIQYSKCRTWVSKSDSFIDI